MSGKKQRPIAWINKSSNESPASSYPFEAFFMLVRTTGCPKDLWLVISRKWAARWLEDTRLSEVEIALSYKDPGLRSRFDAHRREMQVDE